jgi:hypothetical protein
MHSMALRSLLLCLAAWAASACEGASVVGGPRDGGTMDAGGLDASCAAGQLTCAGRCIDPAVDPAHCGGCGVACAGGRVCVAGACALRCPGTQAVCADQCVDLQTDNTHCGACGVACAAGTMCSEGRCAITCGATLATCGGGDGGVSDGGGAAYCADLRTDRLNCGACGTTCVPGFLCVDRSCQLSCGTGLTVCGATCANLQTDNSHCGACGVACAAGTMCSAGRCAITCATPLVTCGTAPSAFCANAGTDPSNCGACGLACALPHVAANGCAGGACTVVGCASGFGDCDGDAANGCEADTHVDNAHCGACGAACAAGTACSNSVCTLVCPAAQTNCSGACANLTNDPLHCGSCGTVCPTPANATRSCVAGACGFVCNAGFIVVAGACAAPTARPVAPLSTSTVTSRRPTLRWALGAGADGARVEVCRDRACAMVLATLDVVGTSAAPAADLPAGVAYWRLRGRIGVATATTTSATWQFTVGARSAPVNTASGSTLDVNGDGYADVAVGASAAMGNSGRVHVFLGGATGLATTAAHVLAAPDAGGRFGFSLASAGDVNGDGYADLVVGANRVSTGAGRAYVFLGGPTGLAATPATTLTPNLVAPEVGFFGNTVASAGDVNRDGYADVIVGAYRVMSGLGRAYVYLGGASGLSSTAANIFTGPDGAPGSFGWSVASAGDLNGDGFGDVIIGADNVLTGLGRAYVYLGGAAGLPATPTLTLTGADAGGRFGTSVASSGDINGDGYSDVVVGAVLSLSNTGRAHVFLGGAGGLSTVPAASLSGPDGLGGFFGFSAVSAGDINGDGYADIAVGADHVQSNAGRTYVYLGGPSGLTTTPASTLTGPDGASAYFGYASRGGDVNGDGYSDLAVGAFGATSLTGRAYVFRGGASGLTPTQQTTLTGPDGAGGMFGSAM